MRINKEAIIFIFIAIVVMNFINGVHDIKQTLLALPGLIIALTLHEYAHARTAVKLGDPTPEAQGRLNISPLSHMDPVGTICLLFAGFGWGKPVQVNPTNFKHPEKDSAKVALAGPLMNFFLMFLFAIIYALFNVIAIKTNHYFIEDGILYLESKWNTVSIIIIYAMFLNMGLGLFNLLPLPPLDGSKIFRALLKGKAKEFLYKLEDYSMIIIMIIFATHITSYILGPIENFLLVYVLNPIINYIVTIAL